MAFLHRFAVWLNMDSRLITDGKGIAVCREHRSLQMVTTVAINAN